MRKNLGAGLALVGILSLMIGIFLLAMGKGSRGYSRTHFGDFSGPVWAIFLMMGIALLALSTYLPY